MSDVPKDTRERDFCYLEMLLPFFFFLLLHFFNYFVVCETCLIFHCKQSVSLSSRIKDKVHVCTFSFKNLLPLKGINEKLRLKI